MTSRRSPFLAPRAPLGAAWILSTLALGLCLLAARSAEAGTSDWVEYVEESASRIVADPGVGLVDDQEKDIISGDLDRDGDTDMVVVRKLPFTNQGPRRNVLFMNEGGVMTDRTSTLAPDFLDETDDRDVLLTDVDGDGWLDVVTATTFGDQPRLLMNRRNGVGGNWLGLVYEPSRLPTFTPDPFFCSLAVGDVTGDQRPEIYFVDYDNTLEDRLLINDGNGFFTDETASRMTPAMANSVFGTDAHIVDVNGDGSNDIVKNNSSGSNPPPGFQPEVSVLYNDGTGNFVFQDVIYADASYMIEPADFTQDGRIDFFIVDDGQDRFLINLGNDAQNHALFSINTVTNSPDTNFFGGNVKFADIDHDGILDVQIADVDVDIPGCGRNLVLLRGQGPAPNVTYSDPLVGASRPWLPSGSHDVEALHIDNDGVLDLWVATCDGNRVFMGAGPAIFIDGFESGDTSAW